MSQEKETGIIHMLEEIHNTTQTLQEEIDAQLLEAKRLLTKPLKGN